MSMINALDTDRAADSDPTREKGPEPAVQTRPVPSRLDSADNRPLRLDPRGGPGRRVSTAATGTGHAAATGTVLPVSLEQHRLLHDLKAQSQRLVQAAMEALNGTRPLQQLSRWLTPEVFLRLQLRRALVQESQSHFGKDWLSPYVGAQVQSIHAQLVAPTVFEAAVVLRTRKRTRAVAIRMEAQSDSWIVTALEIG